jgi:chromosome segregation ATPase
MIGLTPGAASQAVDSLRLLELAADPKKLRTALEGLMAEQAKVNEKTIELRAAIKDHAEAESKANSAKAAALDAQANASEKINAAAASMAALQQEREALASARDAINVEKAKLEGERVSMRNELHNVSSLAKSAQDNAERRAAASDAAEAKAKAREQQLIEAREDLEQRLQALRDLLAKPLPSV